MLSQVETNPTHKSLNRDSGLGPVFVYVSTSLHEDQNEAEVWILGQGLRTTSRFAPPRIFSSQILKFLPKVESQQWRSQVWQPVEAFSAIAGMAGVLVRAHDQYL
jgi:hypothetical protein